MDTGKKRFARKRPPEDSLNIGFISTRFAGTDGVSLETTKWADVLERMGHRCFYFAGQCDRPEEISTVVPEVFYRHPDVESRHARFFHRPVREREDSRWVHEEQRKLRRLIEAFVEQFEVDMLILENCLTIPLQVPLGLALSEFIAESGIPSIAHHHDFVWERKRFNPNCIGDYLGAAFPPDLPSIQHAVLNSIARLDLASRRGIASIIVPNVMDFERCEVFLDDYAADLRGRLGVDPDELLFLQPTRIVQRKGIEHAIEIVNRLGRKACLVMGHASGDEGDSYARRVGQYAELLGVRIIFASDIIGEERGQGSNGEKIYSLADLYHVSDFVTYPSLYEGFGNALLEAVYFMKPIVSQCYSVYGADVKPKGFDIIDFDEYVTEETMDAIRSVLDDPAKRQQTVERNHELARRYFSYPTLRYKLQALIYNAFGLEQAEAVG